MRWTKLLFFMLLLFCFLCSVSDPVSGYDLMVTYPRFQAFDANGDPLSGGKVYTYDAGTTDPKTTYQNRTLTGDTNTNPIILNSRGEAANGIFCDGFLKIVIKDSDDVTITTFDGIKMTDTRTLKDNDNDTYTTVELTSDEDKIRFYTEDTSRGLIDSNGLTLASGASVNEFSTDGTLAGNSDDAVPTEKAVVTYVDAHTPTLIAGFIQRSQFIYKDGDEIYINPGIYHHDGTTEQLLYIDSQLTFQFGSGGSNAASDDLANNDWFYLYLDDSAIVTAGTNVLTASEILDDTTEPTRSDSKHGWYNGSDRCIAAFRTDGAASVLSFGHDGGRLFMYISEIVDRAVADLDSTPTDVTLTIPAFATTAPVRFRAGRVDAAPCGYWRTNGTSGSHFVTAVTADSTLATNSGIVVTDTSQIIEVWHSVDGGDTFGMATSGYYFPAGM